MSTVKHPIAQVGEQIDCGRNVLERKKEEKHSNITHVPKFQVEPGSALATAKTDNGKSPWGSGS